jgi:hypothetical protein
MLETVYKNETPYCMLSSNGMKDLERDVKTLKIIRQ